MAAKPAPSKYGFYKPSGEVIRNLVLSTQGLHKVGKTHFALTAPKPLAYFNLNYRTKGVIEKFADQDIQVVDIQFDKDAYADLDKNTTMDAVEDTYHRFMNAYAYALKNFASVVEDTATEVWELFRLTKLGRLTHVLPHNYTEANTLFRQHVKMARDASVNLIMVHEVKEEWINVTDMKGNEKGKFTGNYIRDGFKKMNHLADTLINCWKETNPLNFGCTILESGQNPHIAGERLEGDFYDFDSLLEMVFG